MHALTDERTLRNISGVMMMKMMDGLMEFLNSRVTLWPVIYIDTSTHLWPWNTLGAAHGTEKPDLHLIWNYSIFPYTAIWLADSWCQHSHTHSHNWISQHSHFSHWGTHAINNTSVSSLCPLQVIFIWYNLYNIYWVLLRVFSEIGTVTGYERTPVKP